MSLAPTSPQLPTGPVMHPDDGSGGGSGGIDKSTWHVFLSGGADYTLPAGFGNSGHHPGDNDPIPDVPQGAQFTGGPLLQGDGTDGYTLTSYTWSFPSGALKGYGVFNPNQDNGHGGTFTTFVGPPTSSLAQNPNNYPFTGDDLNQSGAFDNDIFSTFYWGPNSTGYSTVSVTATFVKTVDGTVVDSFTGGDSQEFYIVKPQGNINVMQFGTSGVGLNADTQVNWLNMDKDRYQAADPKPLGIQYGASISTPGVGAFTVIQTMTYKETRQWTDTAGVYHTEERGFYADTSTTPPTRLTNPDGSWKRMTDFPTLDSLGGIGYGFRLNDPTYGSNSSTMPDQSAAPVLAIDASSNVLYGNDSPGTPLSPPATWNGGSWTRTDTFVDTLMYNPDFQANGQTGASGGSIWVPVGKITWNWSATAGYFPTNPNPHWFTLSNQQNKTGYVATTDFPTWSANRGDLGFNQFF